MRKNSLVENNGLSLSQAQSISNLCNQRAKEIDNKIKVINNFSKKVKVVGETEDLDIVKGNKIPENIVDLLIEKAKLHACQAFLMENIKAKDTILKQLKSEQADISSVVFPESPIRINPAEKFLPVVSEEWGWEQLTKAEYFEYLEAESYAAHIGQFIHRGGKLDTIREELPNIPDVEWMEIESGKKTPIRYTVHHTSEELLKIHEKLADLHRTYEQKVNYFKATVKNKVTEENTRISKANADIQIEAEKSNNNLMLNYNTAFEKANEEAKTIRFNFEITRQTEIKKVAAMRIEIDSRFQETIDLFMKKLDSSLKE